MIPFVKWTHRDAALACSLPGREAKVYIAARFLTRHGWWIKRRELDAITGLDERQTRLALAELERRGVLRRKRHEAGSHPKARFGIEWLEEGSTGSGLDAATRIQEIPQPGSGGSGCPYRDPIRDPLPDPSLQDSQIARAREGQGGTDGLVELARKLWPNLVVKRAAQYVRALRAHTLEPTDAELASYLAACADDATLARATLPLAAATHADRLAAWLKPRRRARRPRVSAAQQPAGERMSARELASAATQALRELR